MARNRKHLGMTLIEITVVVAIIATLVGFGAPAVRALLKSFQSGNATRAMVQSTLDTARTLAMANQRFIGVRFQKAYDWTLPADQQATGQYMIFVAHTPLPTEIGYAREFHALVGHKPIPLPSQYLVTDLMITPGSGNPGDPIGADADVNEVDMTTFTVLFSPAGKVAIEKVRVRGVGGKQGGNQRVSDDRVFNTPEAIQASKLPPPVFLMDDNGAGRYEEFSRDRLYILERSRLEEALAQGNPWEGFLQNEVATRPIYVSPYSGQLIETQP
jgi:prepilin-type N-terminal cleavage/methylation domain-containing protein